MTRFGSLLIVFVLALTGCSFSKDKPSPKTSVVKKKQLELTAVQKQIINAVERRDMASLTKALSLANPSDFDFSSLPVTPMSAALQNDSLEFVQFILNKNLDSFNLGDYQSTFDRNAFNYSLQRALNASFSPQKDINYVLNKSEKYLLVQLKEKVKLITSFMLNNKRSEGKTLFRQSKLSCQSLETYSIFQNSQDLNIKQMLSDFECSPSANPTEVEELFHLELRRGFQTLFVKTTSLDFLIDHPNLNSQLWEISENLWISPDLLYRIARSAENYSLNQNFCKILNLDECEYVERNPEGQDQEWHPQKTSFELVYFPSLDPSVTGQRDSTNLSFRRYPYTPVRYINDHCGVLEKEDKLFAEISLYLNGYSDGVNGVFNYVLSDENAAEMVEVQKSGSKPTGAPGQALKVSGTCSVPSLKKIDEEPFEDFELSVSK